LTDPDANSTLQPGALQELGVAVAVADADWKILFENVAFSTWFPSPDGDDGSLSGRFADFKEERARTRIAKGKTYSFETEIRTGPRTTCLKTTFKKIVVGNDTCTLVESVDVTKQKEYEHMLDSYSDIAEKKGRQLESANRVITAQRDRMQRELAVARDLQMSMLPTNFSPEKQECTLYGMLNPARELGGDFFDYFFVDDRRVCLVVGDVSDKGAASALFAAASKTLIKAYAHREATTADIVTRVNRELTKSNEFCMFVTLFLGILDLDSGEIEFTNGGHEPPFVIRKNAPHEILTPRHGPPVGVLEDVDYSEDKIVLLPGDSLLIYTDGVTDAENPSGEAFGTSRLESIVSKSSSLASQDVVGEIVDALGRHEDGADQKDDVTILVAGYNGVLEN
jgi:serine phosphatase RsbU (regulator of sigma subunit)